MIRKGNSRKIHILYGIYCVILVWIILFKLSFSIDDIRALHGLKGLNLIPFYYANETGNHLKEVLQNLMIFMPFGIYLKILGADNRIIVLKGFVFSLALETCQYIFDIGAADITDLLMNTAGTAAGIFVYAMFAVALKGRERADRILGNIAFAATVLFIGLAIVLAVAN